MLGRKIHTAGRAGINRCGAIELRTGRCFRMEGPERWRFWARSLPGKSREAGVTRKFWSELLEWWWGWTLGEEDQEN